MNVFAIVREYVDRMIPADGTMKVLLLDQDTIGIISTAYTQSQLLERGVFLVDSISRGPAAARTKMLSMRCVAFVRPTVESIRFLSEILKAGLYKSYTLGFSNALSTEALNILAMSDTHELVQRVEEYFADFIAINNDTMLLPTTPGAPPALTASSAQGDQLTRMVQGLTSACLALRRRPLIRMNNNSPLCKRVAAELVSVMRSDMELFDFKARDTIVLIVDRADDPITGLMMPWTYQAMLHELIGLDNNKLHLQGEGYVFCQTDDPFFDNNMYSDWGGLCGSVKQYVDKYKKETTIDKENASLEDLKKFMQNLPQTKTLTGQVTKHATIVNHMSEQIKARRLMEISLLEQTMVAENQPSDHFAKLSEFAHNPKFDKKDIKRLALIYTLKYEQKSPNKRSDEILSMCPDGLLHAKLLRQYYGDRNPATLFKPGGVVGSVLQFVKGFNDVQNVYTQHEPLIKKIITALAQNKLELEQYPYTTPPTNSAFRPKDVILCIAGGATFEEAALVHEINTNPQLCGDIKVLLVSPTLHNSTSFLEALKTQ